MIKPYIKNLLTMPKYSKFCIQGNSTNLMAKYCGRSAKSLSLKTRKFVVQRYLNTILKAIEPLC